LESLKYFTTHTRYLITLRSRTSTYKSLLLFRLASVEVSAVGEASNGTSLKDVGVSIQQDGRDLQMYAMEATCPHLGADLSHAEIEECEDDVVAVCPWHRYAEPELVLGCINKIWARYDFDLRTGKSETGLRACVYGVRILRAQSNPEVLVEAPTGDHWELVELKPVSEGINHVPLHAQGLHST
jgi:nitrite reductase/ring-hydroxylating ferredoxin subunit